MVSFYTCDHDAIAADGVFETVRLINESGPYNYTGLLQSQKGKPNTPGWRELLESNGWTIIEEGEKIYPKEVMEALELLHQKFPRYFHKSE